MRSSRRRLLGVLSLLLVSGLTVSVVAQARLSLGGSSSNYGRRALEGGFTPDPVEVNIVSGGALDSSNMSLGSGCVGFVTRQPDFILDYSDAANFLRFYVTASGDTTLLINDAAGNWHCNDDSNNGTNPMVDIRNPPTGQYDIWVGSYEARANIRSKLHITELQSRHP
ncbi:MAG: peptidase S1 [Deltaproteobacteria bacterium]|nr:peptidase S1 [Deltaproteobacteria bacterium]